MDLSVWAVLPSHFSDPCTTCRWLPLCQTLTPGPVSYALGGSKNTPSHVIHNNTLVNNEHRIQWWFHKIIMNYKENVCLQCLRKKLDLTTMLTLLLVLGGLNTQGASACCLSTFSWGPWSWQGSPGHAHQFQPLHVCPRIHTHLRTQTPQTHFPFLLSSVSLILLSSQSILSVSLFISLFL